MGFLQKSWDSTCREASPALLKHDGMLPKATLRDISPYNAVIHVVPSQAVLLQLNLTIRKIRIAA